MKFCASQPSSFPVWAFRALSDAPRLVGTAATRLLVHNDLAGTRSFLSDQKASVGKISVEDMQTAVMVEAASLNEEAALDRMTQLLAEGGTPNISTFSHLVAMYRRLRKPHHAVAVFEEMLQHGFLPTASICADMIFLLLIATDDATRATQLLEFMIDRNLDPPFLLYSSLVQHYTSKSDLPRVEALLALLLSHSAALERPDRERLLRDSIVPVLEHFAESNRLDDVLSLYRALLRSPDVLSISIFTTTIKVVLQHAHKRHLAFQIVQQMVRTCRLSPTRSFVMDFVTSLAQQELVVSLDYLRYCASVERPARQISVANAAAFALLRHLRSIGELDRQLSAQESLAFLADVLLWRQQYFQKLRHAPLPQSAE